jgi:hypothetical protein
MSFASSHANSFLVDTPMDVLSFSVYDHSTQRGTRRRSKTSHLIRWQPTHAL